ncbi:26823_t:CDS:2, partial [Racocetra persica]
KLSTKKDTNRPYVTSHTNGSICFKRIILKFVGDLQDASGLDRSETTEHVTDFLLWDRKSSGTFKVLITLKQK